jgi:hypothetical protein
MSIQTWRVRATGSASTAACTESNCESARLTCVGAGMPAAPPVGTSSGARLSTATIACGSTGSM